MLVTVAPRKPNATSMQVEGRELKSEVDRLPSEHGPGVGAVTLEDRQALLQLVAQTMEFPPQRDDRSHDGDDHDPQNSAGPTG